MSSIILEAKSLTKEYKQTLALDHINLQIKKGKIYGFIGQNGAGKTTFLRLVTGLAFPTSGNLVMHFRMKMFDNDPCFLLYRHFLHFYIIT